MSPPCGCSCCSPGTSRRVTSSAGRALACSTGRPAWWSRPSPPPGSSSCSARTGPSPSSGGAGRMHPSRRSSTRPGRSCSSS
ncbi:hypothetical protein ACFPRL_17410 [Pseudoclavibacter helvolus]